MSTSDASVNEKDFLLKTGAFDQIRDAIVVVDNQDRLIYLNKASAQRYNIDKTKAIGLKLTQFYRQLWFSPEDEHTAFLALEHKGYWQGINIQQQPDGTKTVYNTTINVLKDEAGNKVGLMSITRDVTERVTVDSWLVESNQRLNYVVEVAGMMVYEIDQKTNRITIIRGLEELLGYTAGEVPDTVDWWISQMHPDDKAKVKEQFYPTDSADKVVNEYRIQHKDGGYIIVQGASKVLKDKTGNPTRIIGYMQNITERRRMEKQLQENEHMVTIGQVAGMVGHDIRNPLQTITSELYIAKQSINEAPQSQIKQDTLESIDIIQEQVDYINRIVSDLQDYSKTLQPNLVEVELCQLIPESIKTIIIPDNIQANADCEEAMPKLKLDPTFMRRILTNLVNNAIQAMPKGGILTAKACRKDNQAIITIEDTGVGIQKEVQKKLFTPLFTTKAKGQGFGLVVVKRMVEAQGGTISFESEVGKGTKFIIELPIEANLH